MKYEFDACNLRTLTQKKKKEKKEREKEKKNLQDLREIPIMGQV